jgi:flagellar motor switch protein FliM
MDSITNTEQDTAYTVLEPVVVRLGLIWGSFPSIYPEAFRLPNHTRSKRRERSHAADFRSYQRYPSFWARM